MLISRGLGSTVEALGLKVSCFRQHIRARKEGVRDTDFSIKVCAPLPTKLFEPTVYLGEKKETTYKGSFQKRFSGIRPLRGGGGTPLFR